MRAGCLDTSTGRFVASARMELDPALAAVFAGDLNDPQLPTAGIQHSSLCAALTCPLSLMHTRQSVQFKMGGGERVRGVMVVVMVVVVVEVAKSLPCHALLIT